ncbi:MAG: hypothetical protein IPJ40_06160 [Saprospirales bacterium]|nr:hypothetical protein [Saprospirales bacterium]
MEQPPEQPTPTVTEEPKKPIKWLYVVPVLLLLVALLTYMMWPKTPSQAVIQAALPAMPGFSLSLESDKQQVGRADPRHPV